MEFEEYIQRYRRSLSKYLEVVNNDRETSEYHFKGIIEALSSDERAVVVATPFNDDVKPWALHSAARAEKYRTSQHKVVNYIPIVMNAHEAAKKNLKLDINILHAMELIEPITENFRKEIKERLSNQRDSILSIIYENPSLNQEDNCYSLERLSDIKRKFTESAKQPILVIASDIHLATFWGENWK